MTLKVSELGKSIDIISFMIKITSFTTYILRWTLY